MLQDHNHVDQYGNPAPCNLREEYEIADINVTVNDTESPSCEELYMEHAPIYIPEPDPRSIRPMEIGCLNKLKYASENGGTVVLSDNIVLDNSLKVRGNMILDLNGFTISNSEDIWDEKIGDWSLISVREGGHLTVQGSGIMKAKENDCYAIDVQDGHCVINGGNFIGNIHSVYVHDGSLVINDGVFMVQQKSAVGKPEGYVVNCLDKSYKEGKATVSIRGGTYKGFDPSKAPEIVEGSSYLEEGYEVTESGDYFIVTK